MKNVERLNNTPHGNRERAHVRAEMDGRVYIHDDNHLFIAPLSNISAGGVFVDGLVSIPKGQEVKVVIKSSNFGKPIQAKGAIVRVENAYRRGSAVQFTDIAKKQQHQIDQSVHDLGPGRRLRHAA